LATVGVMVEKHVISALVERRARVAGELQKTQLHVMRLKSDLACIDACILMFKADYRIESIKPKITLEKNPAALPKGAGSRNALDVLRESGEPLSAVDLARRVLERMGKGTDDKAISMLANTIHSSFSRQKHPVVTLDRNTWPGKWRLLPP
jgi:hypothetical protein